MIASNAFAELASWISPSVIQTYVVIMILLVVGGTVFDVIHKKSAKYFFDNLDKVKDQGKTDEGMGAIAFKTVAEDVLTSAEFCNPNRRIAHLLTMYGFLLYVLSTIILVFSYPTSVSAGIWPFLWTIGALMICVGGYWFWFFIRVDVAAEGSSPFRLVRADLFIVSLLASATFGLIWAFLQTQGGSAWANIFLGLYLIATTVLFGSVPWSKFSHMFFKPAAAFEKRVSKANGSLNNLPEPADRNDPADRDRHSMQLLKDAPSNMGLGIKREGPDHY